MAIKDMLEVTAGLTKITFGDTLIETDNEVGELLLIGAAVVGAAVWIYKQLGKPADAATKT